MNRILKVHPKDNIIVALQDYEAGQSVSLDDTTYVLQENIPVKHKFAAVDLNEGDEVIMYGVRIGRTTQTVETGMRISVENVKHASEAYQINKSNSVQWTAPEVEAYRTKTFQGYHRKDGKVGTRNYWLVFPLVFCENRNIKVIEEAMVEKLGYITPKNHGMDMTPLLELYKNGASTAAILEADIQTDTQKAQKNRIFPNIDGVRFLTHQGGCGGIRQDSEVLCRLLAGYIANPNVAGATVLSLGCQNAQFEILDEALKAINEDLGKPVIMLEQQQSHSEKAFIEEAIKKTFIGLMEANKLERQPAPLSKLVLGLECGGSD
ncbi:MAG: UxaA family hydrolase, partial [Bacteroidota bacterium]